MFNECYCSKYIFTKYDNLSIAILKYEFSTYNFCTKYGKSYKFIFLKLFIITNLTVLIYNKLIFDIIDNL